MLLCRRQLSRAGRLVYLLAILLASTAQADPTTAEQPQLVVSPTQVTFQAGSTSTLRVTLRNVSPVALDVSWDYHGVANLLNALENFTIEANQREFQRDFRLTARDKGKIGQTTVVLVVGRGGKNVNLKQAYSVVTICRSEAIASVASIVGWLYFAAWTVSFYPQCIDNWRRRSVYGFSFDFLALNTLGFLTYSLFNLGLYYVNGIREEYAERNSYEIIQVKFNDIAFSVHAFLICVFQIYQCCIYERGGQYVSRPTIWAIAAILVATAVQALLISLAPVSLQWLDLLYFLSYVKLAITIVKYWPQVWKNYRRQSTVGWSIWQIICDFMGGIMSIMQMLLLAYNADDWASIFGDLTKFGLGFFSVLVDCIFFYQHYVLYRVRSNYESFEQTEESDSTSPTGDAIGKT